MTGSAILFLPARSHERAAIGERLARMGLAVTPAASLEEALQCLAERSFSLCVVDLAGGEGVVPSIRAVRAQHPDMPVTAIIDATSPLVTADAIHAGVVDLLPWPFEERDVATLVANALDHTDVRPESSGRPAASEMLFAHSPAMRQVMQQVRAAAEGRGAVLLLGEPGSGRSMVARAIHDLGPNPDRPFISVDCAAGVAESLEQRLFACGHERNGNGNRSRGAERIGRSGALFQANGGTLLLANPVEAPVRVQAKLARLSRDGEAVLAERRAVIDLDVRLMAAVAPELHSALTEGRLRQDLCERLSQFSIDVPALRRRREDIPLLAMHLLKEISDAQGGAAQRFTRSALSLLAALPWPGNGPELRGVVETLVHSVERPVIQLDDVLEQVRLEGIAPRVDASGTLREARVRFERDWISAVLMKHHGRVGDAARALGIQRTNLYRKVRQLNVARALLAPRKSSA